jgi:tyrosinase
MNHWNWHIKFPKRSVKPIPRRGELFYFFHRELLARYAAERLSNGFADYFVEGIIPVENLVIAQGYNSYMSDGVSGRHFIDRLNNTALNVSGFKTII